MESYFYDLDKLKKDIIAADGIWELDDPPTGIVVYLEGTIVYIGNDYPYISFEGDIEIARKVHNLAITYADAKMEEEK